MIEFRCFTNSLNNFLKISIILLLRSLNCFYFEKVSSTIFFPLLLISIKLIIFLILSTYFYIFRLIILDWLANLLIKNNFSFKLHILLLLFSQSYRLSLANFILSFVYSTLPNTTFSLLLLILSAIFTKSIILMKLNVNGSYQLSKLL